MPAGERLGPGREIRAAISLEAHRDAIDLIHDAGRPFGTFNDDDLIATAIHDVYRDGAEAALRHVERAIRSEERRVGKEC